ncbi:hypothetical protein BDV95DRAFT_196867 [Massariosphaeria phaeospora]|uniref:Uncharacterized protein n=1 Tax=Massariosphaeria phaeospora TaxID=100035 RepID=A0A7C8I6Z4_9PLEO|nr:hypothetical protein BDV95DRAFT_196867 [Massariosphaeria phaeospora]
MQAAASRPRCLYDTRNIPPLPHQENEDQRSSRQAQAQGPRTGDCGRGTRFTRSLTHARINNQSQPNPTQVRSSFPTSPCRPSLGPSLLQSDKEGHGDIITRGERRRRSLVSHVHTYVRTHAVQPGVECSTVDPDRRAPFCCASVLCSRGIVCETCAMERFRMRGTRCCAVLRAACGTYDAALPLVHTSSIWGERARHVFRFLTQQRVSLSLGLL